MFLFGAIFLIAAFLFQQSKENKKQLQLQAMKSIVLTKQNFLETYTNYHNQLDSYLRRYFYSKISGENDPANRMVDIFDNQKRFKISKITLATASDLKGNYIDQPRITLHQPDSTLIMEENYLFKLDFDTSNQTSAESLSKLVQVLKLDPNFYFEGNVEEAGASRTFKVTHFIDLYTLMKHNLNDDFFDAIYITDSLGAILFPARDIGLDLFPSPLLMGDSPISNELEPDASDENAEQQVGNRHFRLNVSSVDQEIFSTELKLGSRQLYLVGAKESEHFRQVALRINFNLLSAFILSLMIILVSIPIVSIAKMDTGDILSKAKVYGVGLSLIILSLILGFAVSYFRHQTQPNEYPDKIRKIKQQFVEHIMPFSNLLEGSANVHTVHSLTNEYLEFNKRGMITEMRMSDLQDTLHFEKPFVSIANRDYVQRVFINRQLYDLSFISAHYSQSTGKLEGVISKSLSDSTGKALTFKLDSLLNETKRDERYFIFKKEGQIIFNSDKIRILVTKLEEAIGEKKWKEINTLINNNQQYAEKSAIWKLPLYVNGYEYEGMLTKIPIERFDQSLWILFLVDHNLQHTKTSLTAVEASAFYLAYFAFLVLLSLMNSLANKQSVYLNIKPFSYSWFGPSSAKRNRFIILNYVLLFDIIGFIAVYNTVKMDIFAVFLFAGLFALHASLCKFVLIFPKQHQKMSNSGFGFILPAALLFLVHLGILIEYLSISPRPVPIIVKLILFILMLLLIGVFFKEFSRARSKTIDFNVLPFQRSFYRRFSQMWFKVSQVNDDKRIFAINFTLWMVLIGFIPGYVIHRSISHHEDYIWKESQKNEKQLRGNLHPGFEWLSETYEGIRRASFNEITDQDEAWIANFLAPNQAVIENAFSRDKVYPSADTVDAQRGVGFQQFIFTKIEILGIILLLLALFIMVVFLTQRIYLTEYLFTHSRYKLPEAGKNPVKNFVISVDNQVGIDWICYQFEIKIGEVYLYDFIEQPEVDGLKSIDLEKAVVFQNIHCIKNLSSFSTPLLGLFKQLGRNNKLIFITSGASLKELTGTIAEAHEKLVFSEAFADFLSYTVPVNFHKKASKLPFARLPMDKMEVAEKAMTLKMMKSALYSDPKVRLLENEVNYGPNPLQLSAIITDEINRESLSNKMSQERFEKCLLTIQRHNKGYYINIWNELGPKERKMVYYYSREGFINYSNRDTLTDLIQKGIFTMNAYEEGLVLFSRSFRNFVTLMITEGEIKRFKEDERRHGNVANIRTAAFSFIFLSIAIISYYDPSVLNKTSAYVSGIIGLIGTITSFLSKGLGSLGWGKKEEAT
jgi:hypothetical protein